MIDADVIYQLLINQNKAYQQTIQLLRNQVETNREILKLLLSYTQLENIEQDVVEDNESKIQHYFKLKEERELSGGIDIDLNDPNLDISLGVYGLTPEEIETVKKFKDGELTANIPINDKF